MLRHGLSTRFTQPDPAFSLQIARSAPGMAHFAGTGPDGAQCFGCSHYGGKRLRRDHHDGSLRPARCRMFERLSFGPRVKKGIDPTMPACRHFEARKRDVPLILKRKPPEAEGE